VIFEPRLTLLYEFLDPFQVEGFNDEACGLLCLSL
jgi:hypothetical protein